MTLPGYDEARANFDWAAVVQDLGWTDDARISVSHAIVDRHATSHKAALYWIGKDRSRAVSTYRDVQRLSNKVANLLRRLGIANGDRVAGVLSRRPETIAIMLGVWKVGGIYVPVFPGFGPDAVHKRLQSCEARAVFVHHEHRTRIADGTDLAVIAIGGPGGVGIERGDVSFWQSVAAEPRDFENALCSRRDPAVILYTSGSTGEPKGVPIAGNFLAAVRPYMQFGVDLRPDDVFWPTGDPGWGYGLVCYHVALSMGVPVVSFEGSPAPETALELLQEHEITNLATVPTLLRGIMALGARKVAEYRLALRCISCCGEPLNSEVIRFYQDTIGVTPRDQFGSSENGLPLGNCNALATEVRPGSMGLPMPGFDLSIVDAEGRELAPGEVGFLAQRTSEQGYYSLGYWKDPERTRELFRDGWIIAGDLAKRDEDGYFWFEGRADDVIKTSGYRVGPFEVESAILHHPAVAEAAVVGKPDKLKGHIIKGYVVIKPTASRTPELVREIQDTARRIVGHHAYPHEVEFVDDLPKTESGKIQRFKLRAQQ